MKGLSLKTKMVLLSLLPALLLAILLSSFAIWGVYDQGREEIKNVRQSMQVAKEAELKNIVDIAVSAIKLYYEGASALDPKAQENVRDTLRRLSYGKDGYIFAISYDGVMMAHHFKPELEGKDTSSLKDANGLSYIKEFINTAKKGGGYVEYMFDKPSKGKPVPKLSYIAALDQWQWLLGAGFYIDDIDEAIEKVKEHTTADLNKTIMFSAITVLAALALVFLASWTAARALGGRVQTAITVSRQVAHGDLTVAIPIMSGDETGQLLQAMQTMTTELQRIVQAVQDTMATVNTVAHEINEGSVELAQRTGEQSSALEATASGMEQLTGTVKQSADHAGYVDQLARAAREQAEQGGQVVNQAMAAMSTINQSSRKIADIISVIDEIAFQTNLLALNAAVEAARAGEQGRGFAVVAGEVRKLAQRSADAAKEIKGLITDSVRKVEDGSRLVEHSGQTLAEIVASVKKVSDLVADMSTAAREQAAGIELANQAILRMDQATRQNSALVERNAAASNTIGDQTQELQNLMGFFKLGAQGLQQNGARPIRGKTGALITWSDTLSVNDPEIDRQHQNLVGMINALHDAMMSGKTQNVMGNLLNGLANYTVEHFQYEEGRMQAGGYPDFIKHKKKHTDLVQQVTALQEKFNRGNQNVFSVELMTFLKEWITQHIQKSDKLYMPYL